MLKNSIRLSLLLGIWCVTATQFAILAQQNGANWNPSNVTYPSAYRSNVTFTYPSAPKHGNVTVPDPYNWMEKPLNESVQLQTFVEEQDKLSQTYLDQCSDKAKISEKIRKGFNVTEYQGLTQYGTKESPIYLYSTIDQSHTKSLQWYLANQTDMDHARDKVLEQPPGRMIFDEKTLEVESASIQNWDIRDTADVAAYSVVFDGVVVASEIRFLNLSSPTVEPAYINETLQYGGAQSLFFTPDGKGLIYEWEVLGDNEKPTSKVFYHQLGTNPKQDILLVKEDETDKINRWEASLSNDKKWMVLNGVDPENTTNTFYLTSMDQNLSSPQELKWISLSSNHTSRMRYMTNIDNNFYVLTNSQNATMFKVAEASIDPNKAQTTASLSKLPVSCSINYDFIPEQKDAKIQAWMILSNKKVVLFHLKNANIHFDMFDLQSGKYDQTILQDFDGEAFSTSSKFDQGFIETSSFVSGSRTYQVRLLEDGKVETNVALDGGPQGIDTSAYKVEQHFAKSKDGTMIPFSVLSSKTQPCKSNGTAWLYFYGSYGKNWFSSYDPFLLPWVDSFGGVFAYIQARGGSELGPKWHDKGMLGNRQNTFDDVQAVAQYMVDNKMAGNGKVILEGYSAGAEVAMAVVNQSPEGLIGTVLGDRGIYDMLRIVKFLYAETQIEEWGDPNTAEGFDWIYPYSPLQNIKQNKTYPAILILPAQNDTIVNNMHSYKMIATLQYLHPKNPKPLLLELIANEGHKDTQQPLEKRIEVGTIKQCFASLSLNVEMIG